MDQKDEWRRERIDVIKKDGQVRRVECPHCRAEVGEDCHTTSWYSTPFHVGRLEQAGVR